MREIGCQLCYVQRRRRQCARLTSRLPLPSPPPWPAPCHSLRRQLAYRNGAAVAQYKPPVVVSKPEQYQLLETAVVATAVAQL